MARTKGGVTKNRILTDPTFVRTRENMAEFARAGKSSKLLRTSLNALLVNCRDSNRTARMTRAFVAVVKADAVNERGLRNVLDGETELMEGFEMNRNSALSSTLYAPYTATIDRVTGELVVNIPSFIPLNLVSAPAGTTHFKINSAGVAVDFENESYEVNVNSSAEMPWTVAPTAAITLTNAVTPNSTHPLFLVLGLEFFQSINGNVYPLKNSSFNAIAIVKVSGV